MLDFLTTCSQTVVAPMGSYIHASSHEFSTLVCKILDMRVRKIAWSSHLCRAADQPKSRRLGARPSLVTIQVENQLQPMAGYRQPKSLLPDPSLVKERENHHKWNMLLTI